MPTLSETDPAAEVARLQKLITDARRELQYAPKSNCPLHWVKVAQDILAEADQTPCQKHTLSSP